MIFLIILAIVACFNGINVGTLGGAVFIYLGLMVINAIIKDGDRY